MDQNYLLQTARKLNQPSLGAASEFENQRESLADELNRRMSLREDLEKLIGRDNLQMMQDNSRNFCRFMSTMFQGYEPEVLVQTVLWVFRAYRAHGFQSTYWAANLDTFVEIIRNRLTKATFQEIYPFIEWLIVNIPIFVKISDTQLTTPPSSPRHGRGEAGQS